MAAMRQSRIAISTIFLALATTLAPALTPFGEAPEPRDPDGLAVEKAELQKSIHLAASYLNGACGKDGKFVYRVNLNPKVKVKPKYNMLRHAGTMYSLAMYEQSCPSERTRDTLRRAAEFLCDKTIRPVPDRKNLLAVWSDPDITGSDGPSQAKLGGAGLGLVALVSIERFLPGTTPLSKLQGLGHFIAYMQKDNGGFYSKYIPSEGGRYDKWTSLYYPGEAALGLMLLYEKDPNPLWIQTAANAIAYLARIRKGKESVKADHWALLATAKLLPQYARCEQPLPKNDLIQHAAQICQSMLSSKAEHAADSTKYGCFSSDGRTCPTATRLEGLLASLTFLPEEQAALGKQIRAAATDGIAFLAGWQIKRGKHAGAITRAVFPLPLDAPETQEFLDEHERATEIRIDYVQHAMSAMIQYEQLFP